jgi:hypothetical protein
MGIIQQVSDYPTSHPTRNLIALPPLPPPTYRRINRYNSSQPGVQSDPEGSLWRDPPEYWEQIVHPAYKAAHAPIFENGDVENGKSNGVVEGLIVMNGLEVGMSELIGIACEAVEKTTEALIHSS